MAKGNVLVIGNSGVGKSTLINSVLGKEVAKTGWGTHGRTDRLEIYGEDSDVPFNVIDTIGFEPGFLKETHAVNAVRIWSKECAKKGVENHQINVIWFCVEGTSRKLFANTIKNLTRAASFWKSVPVVVVITKSYSLPEREENIQLVYNAFAEQKRHGCNLKAVIPVVASPYVINENAVAAPDGISKLIKTTNELMPEGRKAAEKDLSAFILNRKRVLAHSVVTTFTAAGVAIGAAPTSFSDALLLAPTEVLEVNTIAKIYGIGKDEKSKSFLNSIVEAGTVSTGAKALIAALKNIPGINLGAGIINAVIAGVIVAALGEGSIYAFEQVYLGQKSVDDIDWVKQIIESKLTISFVEKAKVTLAKLNESSSAKEILSAVFEMMASVIGKGKTE